MRSIIVTLIFCTTLAAEQVKKPWLTGPLLAPSGHTVAPGRTNWEPYLFVTKNYNPDSAWIIDPFIQITRGLTSHIDLKFETQAFFTFKNGEVGTGLSDFSVILGFQAMEDNLGGWLPDLRITLAETFPTGRYQRLNPDKQGADSTGTGAYETSVSLNFQKLFHISDNQWLRPRIFFRYGVSAPVSVHEFNAYGGSFDTDGKIYPGDNFIGILAFEYTLTRNWALALDIQALYVDKTKFSGRNGVNPDGSIASVGNGKEVQWSYAPALEYNFSNWLGIIWGVWFTGATKNSTDFVSFVVAVNIVT